MYLHCGFLCCIGFFQILILTYRLHNNFSYLQRYTLMSTDNGHLHSSSKTCQSPKSERKIDYEYITQKPYPHYSILWDLDTKRTSQIYNEKGKDGNVERICKIQLCNYKGTQVMLKELKTWAVLAQINNCDKECIKHFAEWAGAVWCALLWNVKWRDKESRTFIEEISVLLYWDR